MIEHLIPYTRQLLAQFGLEGVSAVALLTLVVVGLYVNKAATVGGLVAGAGHTVARDVRLVAVVLVILLLAGLVHADVQRAQSFLETGAEFIGRNINIIIGQSLIEMQGRSPYLIYWH